MNIESSKSEATASVEDPQKLLFVRDVATRFGVSLATARGWLVQLERAHGPAVVGRRGNRLFTTAAALASFTPGARERSRPQHALETRMARFDRRLRNVEEQQRLIAERLGTWSPGRDSL